MKASVKRILALTLALVLALSLAACGKGDAEIDETVKTADGKLFADDVTLNLVIASHASWPYSDSWKSWQYIKEAAGGNIEITAIPSSDFGTKFSLIMATPEELPDIISMMGAWGSPTKNYSLQGAYMSFDDNLDKLPNYQAFVESLTDEERATYIDTRRWADGKIYFSPNFGMERQKNVRAWLYRKDIFDKHNLKVPETMDELYTVCKELKALYPESYPLCMRNGLGNIDVIGASWKPYFCYGAYYDFDAEKWCYGAREDTMLEYVTFMRKMYDEGLIPPNYITITAKEWQEHITNNRGFIMPEYQTRIDFFNPIGRGDIPGFELTAMVPPRANTATGANMLNKFNVDPTGSFVMNTGDDTRIANAFKLIDWFYSDEGTQLSSWGKEGETYEVVDGKKKFITNENGDNALILYGFQSVGEYTRVDPEAAEAMSSDEQRATTDMALEHTVANMNPASWLAFTEEQDAKLTDLQTSVTTYVSEMLTKFLNGQLPLSDWDSFQTQLSQFDIDGILEIYEEAYSVVQNKE